MEKKDRLKKATAFCIAGVMAIMMLQGCGTEEEGKKIETSVEDMLASMKEFTSMDGSVSMKFDENWIINEDELDEDSWLFAANKTGTESVLVMQFPKYNTDSAVSSLEDAEMLVEETGYYYGNEVEAPVIPGMINLAASIGEIESEDNTAETYVIYGETEYASYVITFLSSDMTEEFMTEMLVSCGTFKEDISVIDQTSVEMTETIQWFNTVNALIIEENEWYHSYFAGLPVNEDTREVAKNEVEEVWKITDRAYADETWNWFMTEGRRADYAVDMQTLTDWGLGQITVDQRMSFLCNDCEMDFNDAAFWSRMYTIYEEDGEKAILGWDYCCAMELIESCYLAGYYTETEALDMALEVGQLIQGQFTSWDDLMESYMNGYRYWADEDSYEYQILYQELKARSDGPYAVEFYTTLEKTW